jgi:mannose-1-phosphate guanylyltransferase
MSGPFLVIMAGGSGTRFWPKSTSRRPKQLLGFGRAESGAGAETLLGQTLRRFEGIVPAESRIVVTTQALEESVRRECPGVTVLAEPQARNTAPCVYWAAREVARRDPRAVMMVMPADHYMARPEAFRETLGRAAGRAASHDELVTLGVKPDRPETGYGYLKLGDEAQGSKECRKVDAFVEKPSLARAEEFLRSGRYLWNGGMFLWRAETALRAFDESMPEMRRAWEEAGGDAIRAYPAMTATSIDYGVMEKARNVVTFPLDCGWDDLGSWTSLESLADVLRARHPGGTVSAGELIAVESSGNIVDAPGRLVTILGVSDLIVVEQGDAILVARKDRAQDIKLVVEQVKKLRPELA